MSQPPLKPYADQSPEERLASLDKMQNVLLHPEDFLDVSPEDARRLQLVDGQRVRLRSRHGQTALPVRINETVKPGELFATFHTAAVSLNFVTSPFRDRQVHTPEYKVTAVRIEKL